jgi:hypothetical protein
MLEISGVFSILTYEECRLRSRANFATLKMEAIRSSETSVNIRPTQRHIPEDDIIHSHRNESLKSYILTYVYKYVGFFIDSVLQK